MTEFKITKLCDDHCPACKTYLNAAAPITDFDLSPTPGDVTMCYECTAILTFDDDLCLQWMSDEECEELSPDIQQALQRLATNIISNKYPQ